MTTSRYSMRNSVGRQNKLRSSQIALYRCGSDKAAYVNLTSFWPYVGDHSPTRTSPITLNYVNQLLLYAKFARTALFLYTGPHASLRRGLALEAAAGVAHGFAADIRDEFIDACKLVQELQQMVTLLLCQAVHPRSIRE